MKFLTTTPTANLAIFLLFLLGIMHAIPVFFIGVFESADYLAYLNHQSAVADELEVGKSRQTLLQLEIQKAKLMVQVLQLDVQKANITAQTAVDVARLEAETKKVFFGHLHAEEDRKIDLLRYQERRLLLDRMLQYPKNWERAGSFGVQRLIDDFLMKDKIDYICFAEQADESLM